jgi:Domain of unknown function (DUF6249)
MDSGVLVPIAFFTFIAAMVIVPNVLRYRERAKMHDTLRAAFERGQPVPPEIINALQTDVKRAENPNADLRRAVILIGVALGLVAMSFTLGQIADEAQWGVMSGATIPGFIGLGYLALWVFGRGGKTS